MRAAAFEAGGRHQQQRLHLLAQLAATVEEDALHARGQRQLRRQRRCSEQLRGAQTRGQLQQRERVPAALANRPVGDLAGQLLTAALSQKLPGGSVIETSELERWQTLRPERSGTGIAQ